MELIQYERVPRAAAGYMRQPHDILSTLRKLGDVGLLRASAWQKGPLSVISTLEIAELPGDKTRLGPQWHISLTCKGLMRPTDRHVRAVARDFALPYSEEDNHHPGNARHLWCPVDPAERVPCPCKDEQVIVEPGGYTWSNDPNACRGCEWGRVVGKTCPLHGAEAQP